VINYFRHAFSRANNGFDLPGFQLNLGAVISEYCQEPAYKISKSIVFSYLFSAARYISSVLTPGTLACSLGESPYRVNSIRKTARKDYRISPFGQTGVSVFILCLPA
jgi:hypothetical protein